jgi:3'(2'), 5'-bisphosphate nucleotidase
MFDINTPELKFAIQAVRQAARLVKMVQEDMVSSALTKDDRSPVTVADFASQAVVGQQLMHAFPEDHLVGEEDSSALRDPREAETLEQVVKFVSEIIPDATVDNVCRWIDRGNSEPARRFWTVDPIDGTKGFLRGQQYAIALALVVSGEVQIGLLGCPNLRDGSVQDIGGPGSLIVAARGRGTWTTSLEEEATHFSQLHVSDIQNPVQARFLRSFEAGHTNVSQIDLIANAMEVEAEPVRLDSQAKYAILAGGKGDVILRLLSPKQPDYRERIWDQAAGSLVAEEAGGQITDLDGKPLNFTSGRQLVNNRGVLASNRLLHKSILSAISTVGA